MSQKRIGSRPYSSYLFSSVDAVSHLGLSLHEHHWVEIKEDCYLYFGGSSYLLVLSQQEKFSKL